jgi:hypothetical protein
MVEEVGLNGNPDYISVSTTKTVSVLEHDKTYPDRLVQIQCK